MKYCMKKYLWILLSGIAFYAQAEDIKSMVEFFSYRCSHCANVDSKLDSYVNKTQINFVAINVDNNDIALPTNIMYNVAVDAGIGQQFKSTYFSAVATGMPAYSPATLSYVVSQVKTPLFEKLLKDPNEKQLIKQKLNYATQLLAKYPVQATPTFLINDNALVQGEDFVNYLN